MDSLTFRKKDWRTKLLVKQFQLHDSAWGFEEAKDSLFRIFGYIYKCTNIAYIEFIDESILYNYIKYHCVNQFNEISFKQAIRDVKTFTLFLEKNKYEYIPNLDLSIKNHKLWTNLPETP